MSGAQASGVVIFSGADLLPGDWGKFLANGPVRTFNPGLLREGDGWIFAYRIVGPDGRRRIALCRLDGSLRVVADSQLPLTDHVRFRAGVDYPDIARQWFADPRLYRFGGRVFVYWNSGWHEPRNWQFLQELDPTSLLPVGTPRELVLNGERQKLEKNWTFFEGEKTGASCRRFAVYSILPHRVLEFSLEGDGDIRFEEIARNDWALKAYPASHGGLRGGAPPCRVGDRFWNFCHSVHDGRNGYRYAPAVYCFDGNFPFAPVAEPVRPLQLGNPFGENRTYERLNTAVSEVIYPCGVAWDGARWLVSHGINDEYCAISTVGADEVSATLRPIAEA